MAVDGRGIAKNPTRAAALYERACGSREARGCVNLGTLLEKHHHARMDLSSGEQGRGVAVEILDVN
jgi:TPR repeat protein